MKKISLFFPLLVFSFSSFSQPDLALVDAFVERFARLNEMTETDVRAIIGTATYQPTIIEKMNKPAEKKMEWQQYRSIFLKEERIKAGVDFMLKNKETLTKVSEDTGVPAEILASIIGVETFFGRNKGNYQVLDALYTLAFAYPKRSIYFTGELEEFILLGKTEGLDVTQIKGSYAGAMGYCQFMPSSYRAYAKSFDAGGNRDLVNSVDDAIASVGNYLKVHKWKTGEPIAINLIALPTAQKVAMNGLKPNQLISYFEDMGYTSDAPLDANMKAAWIELEGINAPEYWLGLNNFYVITRYNHSAMYAMAVFQLAEAIKERGNF